MGPAIDVAIGLMLVYLLLALVVSKTQEYVASALGWRAKQLYTAIEQLLGGAGATEPQRAGNPTPSAAVPFIAALYANPRISSLQKHSGLVRGKGPSYITSKTFALSLLTILKGDETITTATNIGPALVKAEELIAAVPESHPFRPTLLALIANAKLKATTADQFVGEFVAEVEAWFNESMARATGWYKRRAQAFAFVLAALVSVLFNVDSITLASKLWTDSELRAGLVVQAESQVTGMEEPAQPNEASGDKKRDPQGRLAAIGIPLGWNLADENTQDVHWSIVILGWLITSIAVSLGSEFWFNALGRALRMRGTGPKVSSETGEIEA